MSPAESLVLAEWRRGQPDKSEAELLAVMAQWQLHPYVDEGQLVAVGLTKGVEFHLLSTPLFKFRRTWVRDNLRDLFERTGYLTTRVLLTDLANMRFNKIFGFRPTWADEQFQYFILTELPFGERHPCPQSS
jgi:hypothetical protein